MTGGSQSEFHRGLPVRARHRRQRKPRSDSLARPNCGGARCNPCRIPRILVVLRTRDRAGVGRFRRAPRWAVRQRADLDRNLSVHSRGGGHARNSGCHPLRQHARRGLARRGRGGHVPQAAPLRRVRASGVRLRAGGGYCAAADVRVGGLHRRDADLLRHPLPGGIPPARRCRSRRAARTRRMGAGSAEGAPLENPRHGASTREHGLHSRGRPRAAGWCRQQHGRRPDGR